MRTVHNASRLWRVSSHVLATPAVAVLCFVALVSLLEYSARLEAISQFLPPASYDTPSQMFDVQMERLGSLQRDGGVDCVFLGSSPVQDGLDPAVFGADFGERTGRRPSCFNLAVPGLRAASTGMLAQVLLDDLDPWLIVYGFSPRDFSLSAQGPALHESAWLRHRAGQCSLRGWIIDHSHFYRAFLGLRTAFQRNEGYKLRRVPILRPDGFLAIQRTVDDPVRQVAEARVARDRIGYGGTDPEAVVELEKLLRRCAGMARVAIVQMPVHPAMDDWLAELESYGTARQRVEELAAEFSVPLWRPPASVIPESGWADPIHTNSTGAIPLSRWLADKVAEAVASGRLRPLIRR